MGLFDIFTNDSAKKAAEQNRAAYQQYGAQATGALNNYGAEGKNLFADYLTNANNLFGSYGGQASGILGGAYNTGQAQLNNAIGAYTPLTNLAGKYGGATGLYLDALGVNGAPGTDRAKAAFTTGPGYNFAVDEATNAAARKAASLGLAGSGNALDEIRNRAQGVASQEYGNYLNRLAGFVNPELTATTGAAQGTAQGYTNLANLAGSNAAAQLGVLGTQTAGQAGALDTSTVGQAKLLSDLAQGRIGIAGNVTGGLASANNAEAQAAQQGSANFWNSLLGLGGNALKAFAPGVGVGR